jgi:signal transduction histidine kinase
MTEAAFRRTFSVTFLIRSSPPDAQGCTGLGLYIVHNLVTDQLGGKITLVSAPGNGTSIRITLPLLAPGASRAVQTGRTPQTMVNVAAVGHGAAGDAAQ